MITTSIPNRLYYYNAGLLRQARVRRILTLAGHQLRLGIPSAGDGVVVWGHSPYAARGEAVARHFNAPLFRLEDAFLRSIHPARAGGKGPIGLFLDNGAHFAGTRPSDLEARLCRPATDANLLRRAEDGIARLKYLDISKYNHFDPQLPVPDHGFVLVVDQVRGDASIRHGNADATTFTQMLEAARRENPTCRILVKTHPETRAGVRRGHFGPDVELLTDAVSPWKLLEAAAHVYTVSSQLGFEAILAGHRPRVFGQPFYAGWGLSDDEQKFPRRTAKLSVSQLFAASMIEAPLWYDPCRDDLTTFEGAIDYLESQVRAFREDRHGHIATGMRLWKRGRLQAVFGQEKRLRFVNDPVAAQDEARKTGRDLLVWAGKAPEAHIAPPVMRRVEDGFLRSKGLGADLVPPLSLVTDDSGIYYDPRHESALERLIIAPPPPGAKARISALLDQLISAGLTKYNLGGASLDLPSGHRVLVVGQVEDDASIRCGASHINTNAGLLAAARQANPNSVIVFKPHPDVEAGLRQGAIPATEADIIARNADPIALITACDEIWTMTSLLGFEALIRNKPVTCAGTPFYAGWGFTTDLAPTPSRRLPRPLWQVAHAALITYPRYYDPVSRQACPAEVVAERLAKGALPHPGHANRLLAKLQGAMASYAGIWRR
ncbi:capsular polysaccharide biosynthesis protein [Falsirhodobacter sp. alg1]|uniref:capsular polysaccharide biosynthesis protein n=1 Tax=Falsirhodobacter sp. alg1 TaxID=1472418 RepID=UPI000789671B|nr:capsular polysaccharide biosynthesis protein [Falsirhodobacter sp. alg1]